MMETITNFLSSYLIIAGFGLIFILGDLIRHNWQITWTRRMVEGVLSTLALMTLDKLVLTSIVIAVVLWAKDFYTLLGVPQIDESFWSGLPVLLIVIVSLIIKDFVDYWNHRLMHMDWLWPIHAIHHSDPDVTPMTSFRVHMLEAIFMNVTYILVLSWLNLPDVSIGLIVLLVAFLNMYVHANIDWHHGPFRYLLASPRYHRWHHADDPAAYGKNLANIIPLWDVLFGTYYNPGKCETKMGIGPELQNNPLMLLIWPFLQWGKMIKKAFDTSSWKAVSPSKTGKTRQKSAFES